MHLSHIQVMFSKGKERFKIVQAKYTIENIPLPLVKQDIQAGQEWIKGAMLCALVTASIGILNVILTIIAAGIAYSKKASDSHLTYAELYQGDCSITSNWTTGMHLVINVLSSILLAARHYVMQCLSALSRADIDKAHSKGNWLDIGILSVRNLWVTDVKSKILWGLLCVSSLPIHMLVLTGNARYNTALFSSISTLEYGIVVIPSDLGSNESLVRDKYEAESFQEHVGYSREDILARRFNGTFRNLSIPDCFKTYNHEFNTKAGTLLLVTDRDNLRGSSSVGSFQQMQGYQERWMGTRPDLISRSNVNNFKLETQQWNYPIWSFKHKSSNDWGDLFDLCRIPPSIDTRTLQAFPWNGNPRYSMLGRCPCERRYISGVSNNITITGCMTSDAEQHCQPYFSLPICIAVIACNIIKVLCMYMTAKTDRREIFLTIGDPLSSFLDKPDATTRGQFFACPAASIYLYYLAACLLPPGLSQDLIVLALLANTPQLVFSTLYLLCNGVFTCMAAVAEYNNFAIQRKPLRVSWPKGEQRSTHYLSLPYRYNVPLITVSVAMHLLPSQSIFLVKINRFDMHGKRVEAGDSPASTQACGYSPLAMFITIIVGSVAIATLFCFSLRPLRSNMPLISSCSTAISAACHPPLRDEDTSLEPVMWGEVRQDSNDTTFPYQSTTESQVEGYGHFSFTSKEVIAPSIGRLQC
ncbi:hypothetical protein BDW67DRAFT_193579 [Aspergillus spinulosporus]